MARRAEFRTRIGVGVFLCLTAVCLTHDLWSVAWFAAVCAFQGLDRKLSRPFWPEATTPPTERDRLRFTLSVAINSVLYSSLACLLWTEGGEGGRVFAMVMLCGTLLHMTLHSQKASRLLLVALTPATLFYFGLPLASGLLAPRTEGLSALAMLAAGALYLAHLARCVRQTNRDTAALMAARAVAEREREAAARANAAKSDFLATISHEIRTPMNAVTSAAHLLQRTPLTPDQAEYVAILLNGGEVLLALINDVLDLSKIEAGKMALEAADVDLRDALVALARLWEPRAAEKAVALKLCLAGDLPDRVSTDPLRLRQILFNLLSNAVKFTEEGEIWLRAGVTDGEGPAPARLWFEIVDSGCGIAEGEVDRLFSGFEQADTSTSRRHGGTGLGLSISRRLARLMGGDLTASSKPGQGSTFRLVLPLVAPSQPSAVFAAPCSAPELETRLSLLIAEDHPVNRRVIELLLAPLPWRLTFAEDGVEAVRAAEREPFDAILMDMQMPVMDGLAATQAIRAGSGPNRPTPILALTANALEHHRAAWAELGVEHFLTKPIDPKILTTSVIWAVEKAAAPDADLAALADRA